METKDRKPALHWWQVSMFSRCAEQYRRRVHGKEVIPPGVALLVGGGAHKGIQTDLQTKIDTGSLAEESAVIGAAGDHVRRAFDSGNYLLSPEEKVLGVDLARGDAIDTAVACAGVAHTVLMPTVRPVHVERTWRIEVEGFPVDFAGTIDCDEGNVIDDWKTRRATPPKGTADNAGQFTMYSLAKHVLDEVIPLCRMGFMVKLKRGPKACWQDTRRTVEDFRVMLRWIERVVEADEKGVFTFAASQDPRPWICAPKYCGYYHTCPGVRHPVSVAVTKEVG